LQNAANAKHNIDGTPFGGKPIQCFFVQVCNEKCSMIGLLKEIILDHISIRGQPSGCTNNKMSVFAIIT